MSRKQLSSTSHFSAETMQWLLYESWRTYPKLSFRNDFFPIGNHLTELAVQDIILRQQQNVVAALRVIILRQKHLQLAVNRQPGNRQGKP